MQLNDWQKDILTEVATIAFGNASAALGEMIKEKVEVAVPTLRVETVETASDKIGIANESVTEVLLKMSGDLSGVMLILFEPEKAKVLERSLNKGSAVPVLAEIGNILAGNALKALSNFLKLNVFESIPDVATDMRRALIVSSVFQLGEESNEVLMLGTKLSISPISVSADVYLLFDESATNKIIESMNTYGSNNRS